jgi:hypothetical protein
MWSTSVFSYKMLCNLIRNPVCEQKSFKVAGFESVEWNKLTLKRFDSYNCMRMVAVFFCKDEIVPWARFKQSTLK